MRQDVETVIAKLGQLWRTYASSFQTGDMKAIMPLFTLPLIIVTREATRIYSDEAELLANNEALVAFYRAQGAHRVEATIIDVEPFHRHFAHVQVSYKLLDADNKTVVNFITVYGLKEIADDWRIHSIIAQDELDAWTAYGMTLLPNARHAHA
jgi:hypothetical protein